MRKRVISDSLGTGLFVIALAAPAAESHDAVRCWMEATFLKRSRRTKSASAAEPVGRSCRAAAARIS